MAFKPPEFIKKEIKAEKIKIKLELEFNNCGLSLEEVSEKISFLMNSSHNKDISNFVVFLLRETRASTWELGHIEVTDK